MCIFSSKVSFLVFRKIFLKVCENFANLFWNFAKINNFIFVKFHKIQNNFIKISIKNMNRTKTNVLSSVADPYHFDTDPDPGCEKFVTDPDPG